MHYVERGIEVKLLRLWLSNVEARSRRICVFTAFSLVPRNFLDAQVLLDPFEEQLDFPALSSVQMPPELGRGQSYLVKSSDALPIRPWLRPAPKPPGSHGMRHREHADLV